MKKLIYTTILFFIIYTSNAQIKEFGIRLGGSLSSIDGGSFDDGRNWGDFTYSIGTTSVKGTKNPLLSLNPTLFMRYYLSEKAFFQPEIGIQFIESKVSIV